jgi:hypothetical protein
VEGFGVYTETQVISMSSGNLKLDEGRDEGQIFPMAKPILSTPPVCGEDARLLLESLKHSASRAEMAARVARAKERLKPQGNTVYLTMSRLDGRRR